VATDRCLSWKTGNSLIKKYFIRWLGIILLTAVTGTAFYGWTILADLPDPAALSAGAPMPSVRVEANDGRLLYEALDAQSGRQAVLPLAKIPLSLQQTTIAVEDRRFYENEGLDATGIARALWINARGGELLAGGSTITQQVTRNLLLVEERERRTVRRKLRESWLAWRISREYSKEEILALYLNHTYYGAMAYGVEAAAQTYFGKTAVDLTLAESALIAGLPQAPGAYNPFLNPEAAKARQAVVLGLALKADFISQADHDLALREPLLYAATPYPVHAPHFVMMVLQQVDSLFTPDEIKRYGGLTARTTLDLNWQKQAEAIVNEQLARLNQPPGGRSGHNANNAALVAMDPHSGAIRALVGNRDYFDAHNAGAVNMALSPRQPGSAIKPLIYAAALSPDHAGGATWTAATMIPDVRAAFPTTEGHPYVPVNFSQNENGPVLVREALASSLNIPAVIALESIGLEAGLDFAGQMGIGALGDPQSYGLSFALGGGAVTLLDLTSAYAVFANGGLRLAPVFIEEITAADGRTLYLAEPPSPHRVLDERVAWLISDILSDNQARTLAFGSNSVLRIDRTAAVKTGTTNNFHDIWSIGYTPDLAVGVWVGNANNQAMVAMTGVSGAGPIWHRAMRAFLAGEPDKPFSQPLGLVQMEVCRLSGLPPTDACPYRRQEWFLAGTQPTQEDGFFRLAAIDRRTGGLAAEGTNPAYIEMQTLLDLPPEFHAWARERGLPLLVDLERAAQTTAVSPSDAPLLRLIYPDPNAVFYLSPALPAEAQRILVQVAGGEYYQEATIWLDGRPLAVLDHPPYQAWWQLEPGQWRLAVTGLTADGETVAGTTIPISVHSVDH
jgi:penicillin-binding protein 1C